VTFALSKEVIVLSEKDVRSKRYIYMTQTPVPKLILKLSVPTIISMLVTGIYNSADTFFVGKISTEATAAVGIVFSVMAIIQAVGFMCGQGSGNYLARMLGANDNKQANEVASTGFAISLIIGGVIAAVGIFLVDPISHLLGASEATLDDTKNYMRIILIGAPFMTGQFVINNQLRFQGSAVYAMMGLLAGAIANIALDPLYIFVFDLGVSGAALATVSGQIISFIVLFIGSKQGVNIHIKFRNIRINGHYIFQIINGGIPSLFRQGLAALATIMLNKIAGEYGGDAAIAGMSVATRTLMLVSSALIGFGQGYQPVCSFNFGANLKKRVKEGYFFCLRYGTYFLIVVAALCFAFAPQIISWFRDDPDVIRIGAKALRFQSVSLPLMSGIVMTNMMLQSIGAGVKASISSSARSGIFFIPLLLLFSALFGLTGVESAQAAADVCAMILAVPFAYSELKKMND
jgi:putative MATE family efflux protein